MEQYEDEVRHQCYFVFCVVILKGFHSRRLAPCMHAILYPLCSHNSRSCQGPNQSSTPVRDAEHRSSQEVPSAGTKSHGSPTCRHEAGIVDRVLG
jgi:hypothetical protein